MSFSTVCILSSTNFFKGIIAAPSHRMIYPLVFTPGVAIGMNIEFLFSLKILNISSPYSLALLRQKDNLKHFHPVNYRRKTKTKKYCR